MADLDDVNGGGDEFGGFDDDDDGYDQSTAPATSASNDMDDFDDDDDDDDDEEEDEDEDEDDEDDEDYDDEDDDEDDEDEDDLDDFDDEGEEPGVYEEPVQLSEQEQEATVSRKVNDDYDDMSKDSFLGKPFSTDIGASAEGLGITVAGPRPEDPRTGCFIARVKQLSSAYANGRIRVGQRILKINGVDTTKLSKTELTRMVKEGSSGKGKGKVTFTVQYNPLAFKRYDNGLEFERARHRAAQAKVAALQQRRNSHSNSQQSWDLDKWYVGKQSREVVQAWVLSSQSEIGDFLVRDGSTRGTMAIVINDHGQATTLQIKMDSSGGCTVLKKKSENLVDAIEVLRTSPITSQVSGKPPYLLNRPIPGKGIVFDFMAFQSGTLKVRKLQPPKGQNAKGPTRSASVATAPKQRRRFSLRRSSSVKSDSSAKQDEESTEESLDWQVPTFPVIRVAIAKRDSPGFGMTLKGPVDNEPRTGVFITKVKEGFPAALEGTVSPGMRVLAMNGKNTKGATKSECVELLRTCLTAVMTLQFDPKGYGSIDGGRLLQMMKEGKLRPKNAAFA